MMLDGLDSPTQDLQRHLPPPADTRTVDEKPTRPGADPEGLVQRSGRRCVSFGIVLLAVPVTVAAFAASTDPDLPTWPGGIIILSAFALGACMLTGAALFVAGLIERLARHDRAQTRQALEGQARAAWERAADRREAQDVLRTMGHALDMIAEHLPEHDQIVNWRGFNHAAREGFGASTGTDDSGGRGASRPRAVRLVPPDQRN